MKQTSLILVALVLGCAGLGRAADPWDAPDYHSRIALTLPAVPGGGEARGGFTITGRDFFRWTGFPHPSVHGFMLGGPHGRMLLQAEERDGTGRIVVPGNGKLDDDDQLVFSADLGPQPTTVYLYYDGPDAPDVPAPARVSATPQPGSLLNLKTGDLSLTVRGGGADDPNVNAQANHGRGSICFCTWQGGTVIDQNQSWGAYFPVTVAAGPGAPKWSDPVVLIAGPVRTVVEVHCTGFQAKEGDKVTMQGDVTHYISVWNDMPCVDFEEAVSYTAPGYDFTWGYYGGEALGKTMDENDRLVAPLMGQAYTVKLPSREAGPYQQFYDTWVPEEGWYALQDTGEKTGLATFYETLAEIHARDEWVAYRPAWNPVLHMRTSPGMPELALSFKDRALRCRSQWDRNLRYFFLRDEKPEEIRFQYACWAQPLDTAGKVSAPEQQK